MNSVLSARIRDGIPFGRVVQRRKETGAANLEPLSVYLEAGVVPRSSRDDNHNRLGAELSNYLAVEPGDIVFNKLRTWQGGLGVSRHRGIVSPAYFVCRPSPDFDPRFLHYLLRSSPYLAEFTRISKFMPPSQFDIAWDDLRLVPVPETPLPEQRAIADFLDSETARINALEDKKRRMIDLLAERTWSSRTQLLTESGHACGWMRVRYAVPQVQVGVVVNPSSYFSDDGVPFIHGSDVREGWIESAGAKRITAEANATLAKSQLRDGDVLVVRAGYPGRAAVVPPELDGANCASVLIFRRGVRLRPEFVAYFFNSGLARSQIEAHQYGAAQEQVNVGHVVDFSIPVPPLEAQDQIISRLKHDENRHRGLASRLARQVALLREHRQALTTAAVTGELQVPGVAA